MSRCKEVYDLAFDNHVRLTCGLEQGHGLGQMVDLHHDEIQDVDWRKPPSSGIGVTVLSIPPKMEAAVVS